jgi:hypothetical protein
MKFNNKLKFSLLDLQFDLLKIKKKKTWGEK